MPRNKCETLSIRTTAEIKDLIRQAAEREHRSVASMLEVLVMAHAGQAGIKASAKPPASAADSGVDPLGSRRPTARQLQADQQ